MFIISIVLLSSFIISLLVSHLYISRYIFKSIENKIYDIFSIIFGISNMLLTSLIIEILEVNDKE